jgi:hypothetical protein
VTAIELRVFGGGGAGLLLAPQAVIWISTNKKAESSKTFAAKVQTRDLLTKWLMLALPARLVRLGPWRGNKSQASTKITDSISASRRRLASSYPRLDNTTFCKNLSRGPQNFYSFSRLASLRILIALARDVKQFIGNLGTRNSAT